MTTPQPTQPIRRPYAALPLLWATVVLVLTLTPSDEMPRTPEWELLSFDTAAHAGVFFVFAALSWFSLHRQRRWPRLARHAGLAVLVGSFLFGALIEVLQMTMKLGRHGEWSDLISDSIGAALAVGLAAVWAKRLGYKPQPLVIAVGLLLVSSAIQAQDIPRARHTIEALASDKMHGRGYVQQGEHIAAGYLRKRLKELKLEPLATNYTQPFTLDVNTFPGQMRLSFTHSSGSWKSYTNELRPGRDFIAAPESRAASGVGTAILLDTLCFTSPNAQRAVQQQARQLLTSRAGYAFLVLTAHNEQRLTSLPVSLRQTLDSLSNRILLQPKLTASLAASQGPGIRIEALNKPAIWYPQNEILALQLDAQLLHNYQTQNLAAVVRGSVQPDSFLVVSAHYDHLGMMGKDVYFPGANDNASGVAMVLELAAHYAKPENRPACSVVFLLFGAEEAGLVGSQYFVAHPLVPLKSIKFLINLDLLGTGEQGATIVNGRVFEAPYRRLVALNDARHYLPVLGARGRAANSDHFPFSEAGVPAFFLYTRGGSAAYHDVNDKPLALSLAGFAGAFGLVRDFLNEEGAGPK
ncbi:VanZ family protein [Hymenobacter negativus]|uniref:M20/M25/M40 family metallo-hydrolase n=1 Tax=Hymenobacter negativus TaxID=2795026 RepID=A0ABS3QNJ4_9BACT|nr:VanZ family protein [Hymenobacter negativus]MBO2012860.1 M20/M25/M40 family metallo-hydrolase [Hymenobacter negativus]